MNSKTIEQTLKANTREWMTIPGIVGTAIGLVEGEPCIKIFRASQTHASSEDALSEIPSTVDGYPVIVVETGEFDALE